MMKNIEDAIRRAEREHQHHTDAQFMTGLARRFPSLKNASGTDPWSPEVFIEWLNRNHQENKAFYAGRFLLAIWSPGADWTEVGLYLPRGFDLVAATQSWDQEHLEVVRQWTKNPYTPFADWGELLARRTAAHSEALAAQMTDDEDR
jgi:hypothetical protein